MNNSDIKALALLYIDNEIARLKEQRDDLLHPKHDTRMSPETRKAIQSQILSRRKTAKPKPTKRRKKLHWMQKPENREKVIAMAKARAAKRKAKQR